VIHVSIECLIVTSFFHKPKKQEPGCYASHTIDIILMDIEVLSALRLQDFSGLESAALPGKIFPSSP
jgi:predicted DNA-binding protein (UPF0251 family)